MTNKVFKVKHGLDVKSGTIARGGTVIVDTDGKISWGTLKGLPVDFTPSTHTHSNYLTQTEVDARITSVLDLGNTPAQLNTLKEIADELAGTNAYVTLVDQITQKAAISHTHDDRYYTETEADGKFALQTALDGKVDDSQVLTNVPAGAVFTDTVYTHPATHTISEVAGLQAELDTLETDLNSININMDGGNANSVYTSTETAYDGGGA